MDPHTPEDSADPVAVAGRARVDASEETVDPRPWLKVRKSRKYMGLQDEMAVVAAGRALAAAGLAGADLGDRTGLYLAVGHIPFEGSDIEALLDGSLVDGELSMQAFSTTGFAAVNPLLTFRCLPNMPAYHVSANFGITGPYFTTYPGDQVGMARELAIAALLDREVDTALLGRVEHQRNFLVAHHHARLVPPVPEAELRDRALFEVLVRREAAP